MRSLVNYLSVYQLISFDRLQKICSDLFGFSVCEGTIFNTNTTSFQKLKGFENKFKEALLNSDVNHADETPIKIGKQSSYLHVLSNPLMTLLVPHQSRGSKAVNEIGVLLRYKGVLISDFFGMYYSSFYCKNAACHAHLGERADSSRRRIKAPVGA